MNSTVKSDTVFFRTKPELCRTISEMVDKNVHSMNSHSYSCVNRAFFTDEVPDEKQLIQFVADYVKKMDKMSIGLLHYSIHKKEGVQGKDQYKIRICGELNQ